VSAERLHLRDLAPQRWKNGAGWTRELARAPVGASIDDFDWRFSVATLEHDAPFSAFAGVDRCIVLLRGAGMRLQLAGCPSTWLTRVGDPFHFTGEHGFAAQLIDGACEDFNVMVRRGRWRADVTTVDREQRMAPADAALLLGIAGAWRCSEADGAIEPLQAWLWRTAAPAAQIEPLQPNSRALLVRLQAVTPDAIG